MSADFGLYEFAVGSTVGIREFRMDSLGRLTGLTHQVVWRPGENLATCRRRKQTDACMGAHDHSYRMTMHTSSSSWSGMPTRTEYADDCTEPNPCKGLDPACACGFYAFYGSESTYHDTRPATVTGIVECYGKTVVGTKGFRAEKGQLVALCIPSVGITETIKNTRISTAAKGFGLYFAPPLVTLPAMALPGAVDRVAFVLFGLTTCVSTSTFLIRRGNRKMAERAKRSSDTLGTETRSELYARVRENYPDVPTYGSVADMLAAHPTDQYAASLTPQSDPDFWDRELTA